MAKDDMFIIINFIKQAKLRKELIQVGIIMWNQYNFMGPNNKHLEF